MGRGLRPHDQIYPCIKYEMHVQNEWAGSKNCSLGYYLLRQNIVLPLFILLSSFIRLHLSQIEVVPVERF